MSWSWPNATDVDPQRGRGGGGLRGLGPPSEEKEIRKKYQS